MQTEALPLENGEYREGRDAQARNYHPILNPLGHWLPLHTCACCNISEAG
jgi:hypothetical protein